MPKRLTTEEFIQKAIQVHGDLYDYSLVEYINSQTKIKIICHKINSKTGKEHGIFEQKPNYHMSGCGCSKCKIQKISNTKKSNIGEFIKKAQQIYGNKYDYSKVNYINSWTKVCVICNCVNEFDEIHGEFWVSPNSHLSNYACTKCSNMFRLNTETFIQKAQKIHNNFYDYSKVTYKNNHTKICIICPKHGKFWQTPHHHLDKCGCPKCSDGNGTRLTLKEFIEKAKLIHGDLYDYSIVKYINSKVKVKIICKIHGIFEQSPNSHLRGIGCPKCKSSKGELIIEQYLKEHKIKYISQYRFENCKNIKLLRFDFYLSNYNTCIEYDGIQHYKPWNGKKDNKKYIKKFKNTQLHDKIKNEYCLKNNIRLIRIPYWDFKNIETILKDQLLS
jgi:very-short-patch-repair endonuclease